MTLTAVTKEGNLLNPSLDISQGADSLKVSFAAQELSKQDLLFCPHCLNKTGEYHQVKFRNAQVKRKHFYHPKNEEEKRECQHYSTESEKHLAVIAAIADTIATTNPTEYKVDVVWLETDGVTRRKPDIWVKRGNFLEVHEVQISNISLEEFQNRSDDLRLHGAHRVCWYLYDKNYNKSIRLWAKRHNVTVYRLWFEDDDIALPRWSLDDGAGLVEKKISFAADACEKKARKQIAPVNRSCNAKSKTTADITHIRKPGWRGVIYDRPWGLPTMLDVQWTEAPEDIEVPRFPSRYPIADLRQNEQELKL